MANKLIQDLTAGAFALTDLLEHQPIAGPPSLKGDVAALVTLLNTIYAPITGGAYVLKAGDTMTGLLTIAQATANTSNLILSGYSLTGANAQSMANWAGTINTSGSPTVFLLNITQTASGGSTRLVDFQWSGVSMFNVDKFGQGSIGATLKVQDDVWLYGQPVWNSSYRNIGLGNSAGGVGLPANLGIGWGSYNYGTIGDAASAKDTGIRRNAAGVVEVDNGTAGTFRDLIVRTLFSNNAASLVSTNTTLTDFAAAALGTLTNAPTAGNPAKWIAIVDNGTTRYIPTWV